MSDFRSSKLNPFYNRCTRPVVSAYAAWHRMVPICTERWCTEANEATQTHCYNPVAPAYAMLAYYAHGRQHRCQEDPVSLPSGRLEKTTRSSSHHVAQHRPTGSETTPPYAPRSIRFGSEPPSVKDDVDLWRYAILELHARNDDDAMHKRGLCNHAVSVRLPVSVSVTHWEVIYDLYIAEIYRHGAFLSRTVWVCLQSPLSSKLRKIRYIHRVPKK